MHIGNTGKAAHLPRPGGAVRPCVAAAVLALALGLQAAHAQSQKEQAMDAALADGMTTAVGVAATAGAINPVGALLTTATKAVTLHRASTLPETEQPAAYAAASAWWQGGTVSNVCITAVFLTGGGMAPACLALGAAWGLKTWDDSEKERWFWERCAIMRQFAQRQDVECVYAPGGKLALAKESPVFVKTKSGKSVHASAPRLILTAAPVQPAAPVAERRHEVEAP
jgi:hypothetical protein